MMSFLFSAALLKIAGLWVRLFKRMRLGQNKPVQQSLLPQDDIDPERTHRIRADQALYAPVRLVEKLHVKSTLSARTTRRLPSKERYPPGILIPKLLVIAALKIRSQNTKPLSSFHQLNNLYRILGSPRVLKTWKDDSEFVRQRLQGINPVWISRCKDPAQLLGHGLSPEVYAQLIRVYRPEHPLYVVNYHELLHDIPTVKSRHLAPAIAFFECRHDQLHPLGIQLYSTRHGGVWFHPDGSPGWTLAKMFFNSADLFVHEALTHLLWTHLFLENFWIAAVRTLSDSHPVRKFLAPHFHFCLNANANSNQILLGENGIFAKLFSAGRDGTVRLFEKGEALWSLDWATLPALLARNGTHDLPGYLYRDDGMLIWQAVEVYARDYIQLYYPDQSAPLQDPELEAWSAELDEFFGPGKILRIDGSANLQSILSAILFSVIQHTFVGAVQYEYIAYPPAMPPLLRIPVPATQEQVQEADILHALPTLSQIHLIVKATYAFSMQYTVLGRYLEEYHSDPSAKAVIIAFQNKLKQAEALIRERDANRAKPYHISRPEKIANSVSA